jgi:hypothetical protein
VPPGRNELISSRQYSSQLSSKIFSWTKSGKSAAEMLAILKSRIGNDPADELPIAAAEQLKITLLRLQKLSA